MTALVISPLMDDIMLHQAQNYHIDQFTKIIAIIFEHSKEKKGDRPNFYNAFLYHYDQYW